MPSSKKQVVIYKSKANEEEDEASFEMSFALLRLLEKELEMQRLLDNQRSILASYPREDINNLFEQISSSKGITSEDLLEYMKNIDVTMNDDDIERIMRRVDKDSDGIISYMEFTDITLLPTQETQLKSDREDYYHLENYDWEEHSIKKKINYEDEKTPETEGTITKLNENKYLTPSNFGSSEDYDNSISNTCPPKGVLIPIDDSADIDNGLINLFKTQINIYAELELSKAKLWLRPDFDLYNLFFFFNNGDYKNISKIEFQDALKELHLKYKEEEVELVIKAYDKNMDGKLNIEEFESMFKPVSSTEAKIRQKEQKLSKITYELTKECLAMIIQSTVEIEKIKRTIYIKDKIGKFSLLNAFHRVDIEQKGYFDENDVLYIHIT